MIYWHTDSWQPAYQMWHGLLHDLAMNRRMATQFKMTRKPKLHQEYVNLGYIRATVARNALQMWLLEYADASPSDKLPHVEQKDVEAIADGRVHESIPERADATHYVLTELGKVMAARRCEPPFPKLLPPRI
jgi:hypothetical protein